MTQRFFGLLLLLCGGGGCGEGGGCIGGARPGLR